MIIKNKKRGTWALSYTAQLILALVFVGVGLFMVKEIGDAMTVGYDKGLCKQSVVLNSKFRIPILQSEEFEVKCPTRYVTIEPEKIIVEALEKEHTIKIPCGNLKNSKSQKCFNEKVNSLISGLIFDCWDQFGAGQLNVFNSYERNRQCIICSRIEFTEGVKNALGEDFWSGSNKDTSLQEYMITHNPKLHEITYYEFSLDAIDAFSPPVYEYDLNVPYAVVFSAMNERGVKSVLEEGWALIKKNNPVRILKGLLLKREAEVEAVSEEKEGVEFVNILQYGQYSDVREICDSLK